LWYNTVFQYNFPSQRWLRSTKQQRRHEQELFFICSAKGASFTRADAALAGLLEA
jgi:hypothetical protein